VTTEDPVANGFIILEAGGCQRKCRRRNVTPLESTWVQMS